MNTFPLCKGEKNPSGLLQMDKNYVVLATENVQLSLNWGRTVARWCRICHDIQKLACPRFHPPMMSGTQAGLFSPLPVWPQCSVVVSRQSFAVRTRTTENQRQLVRCDFHFMGSGRRRRDSDSDVERRSFANLFSHCSVCHSDWRYGWWCLWMMKSTIYLSGNLFIYLFYRCRCRCRCSVSSARHQLISIWLAWGDWLTTCRSSSCRRDREVKERDWKSGVGWHSGKCACIEPRICKFHS